MDFSHLPYRSCVGIMLLNSEGHIFTGCRSDISNAWQMPQGGIEEGETIHQAALRELLEEIGTNNVDIIGEMTDWISYDFPDHLLGKAYEGRYKGQKQKWVLARFKGQDSEINIATPHQEFVAWRWINPDQLLDLIVPFKRKVYEVVLKELLPLSTSIS